MSALLHLLCHLYVQRSFSLWKASSYSSWFSQTVISALASLSPSFFNTTKPYARFTALAAHPQLALSIYRHTIVLETSCRRLFGFIPRGVTNTKHLACDPLPPLTCVSVYDDDFFHGVENALAVRPHSRKANDRMLERLIPDPVFRRQLQVGLRLRFLFILCLPLHISCRTSSRRIRTLHSASQGGIVQFAQLAGQLPEDALEDLMIAEAAVAEQQGGHVMPGEMVFADLTPTEDEGAMAELAHAHPPAAAIRLEESDDGDGEEEDDREEDVAVRLMNRAIKRFFMLTVIE